MEIAARDFKLAYQNGELLIRCTYEADYSQKTLNISCYEYRVIGEETIYSDGEYSKTEGVVGDTDTIRYINVSNITQTLSMVIM